MNVPQANRESRPLYIAHHRSGGKVQHSKPLATVTSLAFASCCAFAITAPTVFAEFTSTASVAANSASSGTLEVQLVDSNGAIQSSPYITLTNAQPAMAVSTHSVRVKNAGSLSSAIRVTSANVTPQSAADLNDVLQLKVLNATGTELYSGTINDLDIFFASVSPGSTMVLTFEIRWPDLPGVDDNPYQDAGITFEVVADASSLAA